MLYAHKRPRIRGFVPWELVLPLLLALVMVAFTGPDPGAQHCLFGVFGAPGWNACLSPP